jgi:hypothetical protein
MSRKLNRYQEIHDRLVMRVPAGASLAVSCKFRGVNGSPHCFNGRLFSTVVTLVQVLVRFSPQTPANLLCS